MRDRTAAPPGRGNSKRPSCPSRRTRIADARHDGFRPRSVPRNCDTTRRTKISLRASGTMTRTLDKSGSATASTVFWASTKAGRSPRTSALRYSIEWHEDGRNAALEERETVADFRLFLDRKSVVSGKSGSVRVDLGGRRNIK